MNCSNTAFAIRRLSCIRSLDFTYGLINFREVYIGGSER